MSARDVALWLLEMGSVEARSNREYSAHPRPDGSQAGPDPEVQRELKNHGILYRAAKAGRKPRLSHLKNKLRHTLH